MDEDGDNVMERGEEKMRLKGRWRKSKGKMIRMWEEKGNGNVIVYIHFIFWFVPQILFM